MSTGQTHLDQGNENTPSTKVRSKAIVWDYFVKIKGDDGLQKTRCTNCNKVYSCAPNSGTSTMRRHLRKCSPQPLTQLSPESIQWSNNVGDKSDNDELANEGRAAKKFKYVIEDLEMKTDRELMEFIWMNKRNIGLLEEKLPDKAIAIKEAIKCYEDEINRRAKLHSPKEKSPGGTSVVVVKVEVDEKSGETTGTNADVNQRTSGNGDVSLEVGVANQSVLVNGKITEEEHAGGLQIVAINGDENRAQDICTELRQVSSVLSLLTSPNSFYTPQNNPLDSKTEQAKRSLVELLKKDFKTLVGSPDEQTLKSCIQILIKNLDKLPKFQGRVIETLHTEFESACQNWSTWHRNIQENIACEVKQGDNLEVLQEWQEKDLEVESKIMKVDADIERLKAELREKELTREGLVKRKFDLFNESKISIDEAKKVLKEMVAVKLRSDVAVDNMNELAKKWERIRENFLFK